MTYWPKWDCLHECPDCHYLTTCVPPCTREDKNAPKPCPACRPDLYLPKKKDAA